MSHCKDVCRRDSVESTREPAEDTGEPGDHRAIILRRLDLRFSSACAVLFFGLYGAGCSHQSGLPKPGSGQYRDLVRAFYIGLAALQSGDDVRAAEKLRLSTQLAPGEPASWANLGLLAARQQDFEAAYKNIAQALSLAPRNSRIEALIGEVEALRGKLPEGIGHLRRAIALDPKNLKALYSLAEETERSAQASSDREAQQLYMRLLDERPDNVAVLLEVARLAARSGDNASLQRAVGKLTQASALWPPEARQQMTILQQAAAAGNARDSAIRSVYLRNTLARAADYRKSLNEVKTPSAFVSDPFLTFLSLPAPRSEPSAADLDVRFEPAALPDATAQPFSWIGAIPLDDSGKTSILWADSMSVQIAGGATLRIPGRSGVPLGRHAILGADLNYDFRTDLIFAGRAGLVFYQQKDLRTFVDITRGTRLAESILKHSFTGAWGFDVDLDGDLDIVLGTDAGEPVVLRNNGDQTFATLRPFPGIDGLTEFASADLDGDGDPDVVMIDRSGSVHVFSNDRLGQYRSRALPADLKARFRAVATADINNDGAVDIVLLREDGAVIRLSDKDEGDAWDSAEIARADVSESSALIVADFDNNGALDLLVGDGQVFVGDSGKLTKLGVRASATRADIIDWNGDGRIDVVGLSATGEPRLMLNRGKKNYHWQNIRPRAAQVRGDQRINSFGIGGEIEVRAGLLTQKQVISSQLVHFGLGEHTEVDAARITWPNGVAQGEFELKADAEVLARQRLKGSCPWLFAWNGKRMCFVKDGSPWSAALGLHINAQHVAGIQQTEEWFKIPGESLQPRDGYYDLRVTGELWETYYIDHYSLLVVDHPEHTEIYTDERFAVPPPPLKIFTTGEPAPFASARDDSGQDVAAQVRDVDQKYLDTFGRGPYQGLTRDHWVELELPAEAPGQVYLLASGWTHPTDATVNIAIGQNSIPQPSGLSIETPDARGRWVAAKQNLGFPAGKLKTIVLDLNGIFRPGAPRRLRLRTNLEIYWDQLAWATPAADRNRIQQLALSAAELRYRGFSAVKAADPSSPELPDYDRIASTGQIWHDLKGYVTRYGNIRELLEKVDDRIAVTNAGDEVRLRFQAPAPPPAGWKRDYVMIGDGWIKDGDFNSVYSNTVLPLPYHGMKDYNVPPGRLEDDPAYKLHPADWQKFHTRYVSADMFRKALKN